jgi:hypothetical protein
MATTCNFGQVKDLRVRSLCVDGKEVIDSNRQLDCITKAKVGELRVRQDAEICGNVNVKGNETVCGDLLVKGTLCAPCTPYCPITHPQEFNQLGNDGIPIWGNTYLTLIHFDTIGGPQMSSHPLEDGLVKNQQKVVRFSGISADGVVTITSNNIKGTDVGVTIPLYGGPRTTEFAKFMWDGVQWVMIDKSSDKVQKIII